MCPRVDGRSRPQTAPRIARIAWAVLTVFVVESVVIGLAAVPAVAFWRWHLGWRAIPEVAVVFVLAMAAVPAYLLFAVGLMVYSALLTRLLGWRTPDGVELRIADHDWPVLDWARYLITTHVVRVFAGAAFRSTPIWAMYMRLNGARIGRGCWVNSLALMDHNLLEIGDGSVIGSDAHVSGHTVERGVLKTGRVRIGEHVTIGIGCVVGIDSVVGAGAQVGALSVVPKHAVLEPGGTYAGVPASPVSALPRQPIGDPARPHA